jgi:predicted permease
MRALARTPVFAAIGVASLALGIGGTTAIFSLLHTVLLERLAIPRAEELVALRPTRAKPDARETSRVAPMASSGVRLPLSVSVFRVLANTPTVPRIEAFATAPVALRVGDDADYPYADFVSGGYFDLLYVRPERGRWITPSDDDSQAPVAVISHQYWQRMFAGDDGIIGRVVDVGTARVTIIGVAPPSYRGLYFAREFTVALPLSLASLTGGPLGGDLPVTAVTRRARTVSIVAVAARLDDAYQQCCASEWRLVGEDASRGLQFAFDPRQEYGRLLKLLMGGVAILLIVACANVAALLLARALARRREIAIRMAMGASRSRIARLLLVESALLTIVGTVVGLALARLGTGLLSHNLPGNVAPLADLIPLRATGGILGFTIAVSAVCIILFGTLPALRAARTDARESLSGEQSARPRKTRWPSDRILVVVQVGLALALLSTTGLMTATLRNLERGASAFSDSRLLFVDIDTRSTAYQKTGIEPLREDILSRVRSVPDVRAVALAYTTPVFGRGRAGEQFTIVGRESTPGNLTETDVNFVTSDFFVATSLPILRGRAAAEFEADAVTVSESFAKRFFPGRDALGAELVILGRPRAVRIVGVVADARYMELREPARPIVYLALTAWYGESLGAANLVVRTAGDPRNAAQSVRDAIVRVAPRIRLRRVETADQALAEALPRERLAASLALLFGVLALGLAGVGLYEWCRTTSRGVQRRSAFERRSVQPRAMR